MPVTNGKKCPQQGSSDDETPLNIVNDDEWLVKSVVGLSLNPNQFLEQDDDDDDDNNNGGSTSDSDTDDFDDETVDKGAAKGPDVHTTNRLARNNSAPYQQYHQHPNAHRHVDNNNATFQYGHQQQYPSAQAIIPPNNNNNNNINISQLNGDQWTSLSELDLDDFQSLETLLPSDNLYNSVPIVPAVPNNSGNPLSPTMNNHQHNNVGNNQNAGFLLQEIGALGNSQELYGRNQPVPSSPWDSSPESQRTPDSTGFTDSDNDTYYNDEDVLKHILQHPQQHVLQSPGAQVPTSTMNSPPTRQQQSTSIPQQLTINNSPRPASAPVIKSAKNVIDDFINSLNWDLTNDLMKHLAKPKIFDLVSPSPSVPGGYSKLTTIFLNRHEPRKELIFAFVKRLEQQQCLDILNRPISFQPQSLESSFTYLHLVVLTSVRQALNRQAIPTVKDDVQIFLFLLANGADPYLRYNYFGDTLIHFIARLGDVAAPFLEAIVNSCFFKKDLFFRKNFESTPEKEGKTPLTVANEAHQQALAFDKGSSYKITTMTIQNIMRRALNIAVSSSVRASPNATNIQQTLNQRQGVNYSTLSGF